jgi:hypothetical protein
MQGALLSIPDLISTSTMSATSARLPCLSKYTSLELYRLQEVKSLIQVWPRLQLVHQSVVDDVGTSYEPELILYIFPSRPVW